MCDTIESWDVFRNLGRPEILGLDKIQKNIIIQNIKKF